MKLSIIQFIRRHTRLSLFFIFLCVVFIPGAVLGILAFRALDREEAFLEKSMQASLRTEVSSTASLIQNEMDLITEDLDRSLAIPDKFIPFTRPEKQAIENPLVGIVFAVSNKKEILWPKNSNTLSEQEKLFLYFNSALFTDSITIPIVKNITREYREEIIQSPKNDLDNTNDISLAKEETKPITNDIAAPGDDDVNTAAEESDAKYSANERRSVAAADEGLVQTENDYFRGMDSSVQRAEPASPSISTSKTKKVFSQEKEATEEVMKNFEESAPIRDKIYEQAEKAGAQVLKRNVVVDVSKKPEEKEDRSVFILSPGTFSDITAKENRGLFPRIIGDRFELLFWKKTKEGHFLGCVIDEELLQDRITAILPELSNSRRILTVLDENAEPIAQPEGIDINWRQPFVAQEIHEALPRWEVAAYMSDPEYIHTEAVSTTNTLWVIISALLFFLLVGGVIIISFLMQEIRLAEQKTSFVANVSHELKTPLTSIRLFAEMLVSGVKTARKKQDEYLRLMLTETERLSRLIGNVLDFQAMAQHKKRYNKRTCDFVACLKQAVDSETLRLEKEGITLRFTTRLKKLMGEFCPESLMRVIINLVSNAEKYAESGKEVTISLQKVESKAIIQVMDRGPGIPAWAAKKIFKAFYRIDDSSEAKSQGSGLGLAIVNRIIRDHNGTITVQNREGGGSCFTISLPLSGS
ncbi:MAG: HAMP domain-containing histidine kinase [Spirochaetales bacterium]|nr:HAMP domain-containing histidine kinase [Spirochaetales bacterium]